MSSSALAAGIRQLRRKLAAQQVNEDCDEQLLHVFLNNHDESAFAALVHRHGPMGVVSASVAELALSAAPAAIASKAKMAAVVMLLVATSGALVFWYGRASGPLAATVDNKAKAASPPRETTKKVQIQGRVFGPDGKAKAGAKLLLLGEDKKIAELGVTAADGRFAVSVPKEEKRRFLIARTEDTGFDLIWTGSKKAGNPVELHLVKDQPIRGRVVNTEGKPVAGVRVEANDLNIYRPNSLDQFLAFWKNLRIHQNPVYGDYQLGEMAAALFSTTTDTDGRFVLRGLGEERFVSLRFRRKGIADTTVWFATRPGFDPKPYNNAILDNSDKDSLDLFGTGRLLHGPDVNLVIEAEMILRGVVKDADTGKRLPHVVVYLNRPLGPDSEARADADGRYEFRGVRKAKSYHLQVHRDAATCYVASQVQVDDNSPGYQPVTADIRLKKGVIVTGKMIDRATGKPIDCLVRVVALRDNPFLKKYPPLGSAAWNSVEVTDANGVFRIVAIPGPVLIMGGPRDGSSVKYKQSKVDPKYRQYFRITPYSVSLYLPDGGAIGIPGLYFKVLEIDGNAARVELNITLERLPALTVQIRDAEGKPLTHAIVAGLSAEGHYPAQFAESTCTAHGVQPGKPRLLIFYQPIRKLAQSITLKGDEKSPIAVKLGPAGAIKGRLLDAGSKPLAGVRIELRYRQRKADTMNHRIFIDKQIETDAKGNFKGEDVLPGFAFELSFRRGRRRLQREAKPAEAVIQVKPGECRDLGTITAK